MLIGLLSDSHDHIPHTEQAIRIFRQKEVDRILHAGDYCSPFMIPLFEGLPLIGVFGNNDGDKYLLMQKFAAIDGELLGSFGDLTLDGCRIALYHGTDAPVTKALEQCDNFNVVVSGHTHEKKLEQINTTIVVNPGTVHGFGEEASIALLNTSPLDIEFIILG